MKQIMVFIIGVVVLAVVSQGSRKIGVIPPLSEIQENVSLDAPIFVHPTMKIPIESTNEVRWLESVVTERWIRESDGSYTQEKPAIYGQVGDVRTIIGLRSDGMVVWKWREDAQ